MAEGKGQFFTFLKKYYKNLFHGHFTYKNHKTTLKKAFVWPFWGTFLSFWTGIITDIP